MAEERKITKQFLLEHLDDDEMDLGMINLTRVPVKELVSGKWWVMLLIHMFEFLQAQIPRMTKLDLSRNHLTSLPVCGLRVLKFEFLIILLMSSG